MMRAVLAVVLPLFAFGNAIASLWSVPAQPAIVDKPLAFDNGAVHLDGTLYIPARGNHLPAVVALHDASAPTREFAMYRHLEQGLPAMGIAVLVFDRRGSGKSSGTFADASYDALAGDAIAGARALAREPRIDGAHIGYWGISQGGWISVIAGSKDPRTAFVISVSAPLVTASEQMHFATANELRLHGASERDVHTASAARDVWEDYLRGRQSAGAAHAALAAIADKPWFGLTFMPRPDGMAPREKSGYRLEMDEDPIQAIGKVSAPIMYIFGGEDPWIPVGESVRRLNALARSRQNIETRVIDGASHEMVLNAKNPMAFDRDTMLTVTPDAPVYFMTMGSWLARNVLRCAPDRAAPAAARMPGEPP